jgi:hypothetical protein
MTREIISAALESEGLKAGSQGFTIAEDREATCLVSSPGEVMSVSKVVVADLREKYLYLQTAKDERYFFGYDVVLGLRLLGKSSSAKERSAGFSR